MSETFKRMGYAPERLRSRRTRRHPKRQRSLIVLLSLLLVWSLCLGIGLAQATEPRLGTPAIEQIIAADGTQPATMVSPESTAAIGTVDVIPDRFQLGKTVYLENCATCHVGIPPEVMPIQTWQQLLQDPQHYGAELKPLVNPGRLAVWNYMRAFSRPLATDEDVPYRLYQSYYFKALHPRVPLPARVGLSSCIACHPGADQYNFRRLTPEWQNAP
jgi:hypothetical protein